MHLTPQQLAIVNSYRDGQLYSDELAAQTRNGTATKPLLTESPFVRFLEYGANSGGYWNYEHMVLQFNDCMDVITALYEDYEPVFLFDHSCGHDRMKPDGLSIKKIRKNYGGMQPIMRDTQLTEQFQNTGPFLNLPDRDDQLNLGDTQRMYFKEEDRGPFHFTPAEAEAKKYDRPTGRFRERYILKSDLIIHLKAMGIPDPKGNLKQLQQKANELNLPVKKTEEIIEPGWVGKPKGSLQILYERGWIDPTNLSSYTAKGTRDEMGILRNETSINLLMERQQDFHAELTLLQFHRAKLGAIVDRSPKCHPEIAGEGIEYVWALAKLWYRRQPINLKRKKEQFHSLVRDATATAEVLNIMKVRKCSRRARQYMLAYKAIAAVRTDSSSLTHKLIEKCVKTYKCHRSALDTDLKFVRELENQVGQEGVKFLLDVVSKMNDFRK